MTVMVFRARRTLKVLRTETFPKSTNSVKYLQHKHTTSIIRSMTHICLNLTWRKTMMPHSRHTNDHEVQPVPGVFEEGELSKTKAP